MHQSNAGESVDYPKTAAGFSYDLPGPIWLYVGRVCTQKNVEGFLRLELPGSKVIVGDGPDRARLQRTYPRCHFAGYRFGGDLVAHLTAADVFVYPGKSGTFGLVMLEAMACGLPIAAMPLDESLDVIHAGVTGILDHDLERACLQALKLDREMCRRYARSGSWRQTAARYVASLARPVQSGNQAPVLTVRSNS